MGIHSIPTTVRQLQCREFATLCLSGFLGHSRRTRSSYGVTSRAPPLAVSWVRPLVRCCSRVWRDIRTEQLMLPRIREPESTLRSCWKGCGLHSFFPCCGLPVCRIISFLAHGLIVWTCHDFAAYLNSRMSFHRKTLQEGAE